MARKNKAKKIAYMKAYRQRPEVKERERLWKQTPRYKAYQKVYKQIYQKQLYGLTPETFSIMLANQNGACAICEKKMTKPQIDHCHKTKFTRGLLCIRCNLGLSFLENDEYFKNVQIYLRRYHDLQILSRQS